MNLDTDKQGLCALFKPYKVALLKHLYAVTTPERDFGVSSGYLWNWLNDNAERLGFRKMSRSSVIHALNDLVDDCLIKCYEETVSTGFRKRYSVVLTPDGFKQLVSNLFIVKLESIFEGDWWSFEP